ncbi:dynamin family protein [Mariniluteicoccus flavus]
MSTWSDPQRRAVTRAREVFTLSGYAELAGWLDNMLATDADRAPIVVVGEVKRGKSSLLNALLAADLLPVGVDVTTGGFIRVVPGDEPSALVLAGDERRPAPLAGALRAVTVGAQPLREGADDLGAGATGVEITWRGRWLPDDVLVDTPGIGGLDSSHAELAIWQASRAGVLLVVLDGGQVMTQPELDAIVRAAGHVAEVVVAVSRTDRHPQGWRTVVAEDRAILAGAGLSLEIVPVSAALAEEAGRAEAQDDTATAALLWQASGVPALATTLRERTARARAWPAQNALRAATTGLERFRDQLTAERAALDGRGVREVELTQRRDRLRELTDHNARWPLDLQRDLARLRQEMTAEVGRRLDDVADEWLRALPQQTGRWTPGRLDALGRTVDAALRVAAEQMVADFHTRLYAVVNRMFATFDSDFDLRPFVPPVPAGRGPVRVPPRRTPVVDPSVVSVAMIGAGLAPQFGSLVGIATGVGLFHPAGLVFAGALVALNVAFRNTRAGRQQVTEMLNEAVRHLRADLLGYVDAVITETSPEIRVAYAAEVRRAMDAVNAELASAEKARRADAAEMDTARRGLDKKLAVVDRVAAEVAEALEEPHSEISSAHPGTSAPRRPSEGHTPR